jgi:hypothetical protein
MHSPTALPYKTSEEFVARIKEAMLVASSEPQPRPDPGGTVQFITGGAATGRFYGAALRGRARQGSECMITMPGRPRRGVGR